MKGEKDCVSGKEKDGFRKINKEDEEKEQQNCMRVFLKKQPKKKLLIL